MEWKGNQTVIGPWIRPWSNVASTGCGGRGQEQERTTSEWVSGRRHLRQDSNRANGGPGIQWPSLSGQVYGLAGAQRTTVGAAPCWAPCRLALARSSPDFPLCPRPCGPTSRPTNMAESAPSSNSTPRPTAPLVSREEALANLSSPEWLLVDVRRNDYEGGAIEGSINLPAQSFALTRATLYDLCKRAGVSKIAFYCGTIQTVKARAAR